MMKMDCDIIQDLIPSYVDEICSEASKRCVEEHIAECENCKKIVQLYRENELTGNRMEQREVDGFKKLKAKMKRQNIVSLCLLLLVVFFGIHIFQGSDIDFSLDLFYVLLAICIIVTFLVGKGKEKQDKATRKEYLLLGCTLIATDYIVGMVYYCINSTAQGVIPFGMEARDLGPFLHTQLGILCLAQATILEELLRGILKKNRNCQWMLPMNLAGTFIVLSYTYMLGRMSSPEGLSAVIIAIGASMTLLGVLGSIVHLLVNRVKNRKDKAEYN